MLYTIYSAFPWGRRDNAAAVPCIDPWPDFAAELTTPIDTDDKHAVGFSPLVGIEPGKGGRSYSPKLAGFVACEWDTTATWPKIKAAFESRHALAVYTTASATAECPRFRVVAPVSRPIVLTEWDEYAACVSALAESIGEPAPESYQVTRLWYRPITRGKMPPISHVHEGEPVDVDAAVRAFPPTARPHHVAATVAPEDRKPRHPLGVRRRVALWESATRGRVLVHRSLTSGSLQGRTGFASVRALVFPAIRYGVPLERVVARMVRSAHERDWSEDEIEAAVVQAWNYSTAVEWESSLVMAALVGGAQ